MQRIFLYILFLILPLSVIAQQKTKIILQDNRSGIMQGGVSYLKYPVFRHLNATLSCDSAVFYESRNVFEAFKNVHINQGDTINIYSDFLTYDGNTKIAHLTSNVRMVDKDNVLTTNTLDYNMATKVGTYIEGGKIVNKDVTLTSTNGYYFSNSRDAYFRYNVVVVSPSSTIKSDTLRYNTLTNWAYFYGPTNIKGKDDNLYTENGAYNTKTEYAYFGKKNLYTNASKSLKGDSLYYDGKAGYGKAVRNIIFRDTSDKTVMYGQLGYYYKKTERAVVTKNAYVGMGTKDSIMVKEKLQPDSLWLGADTLETQMTLKKSLKLISSPTLQKDNELGEPESESSSKSAARTKVASPKATSVANNKKPQKLDKKAIKAGTTDTSKIALVKDSLLKRVDSTALKKLNVKRDSLTKAVMPPKVADSLAKLLVMKKPDSLAKNSVKDIKAVTGTKPITGAKAVAEAGKTGAKQISGKTVAAVKDSLPINPADTVKARIIKAYHNVRVYKSNMQAVADSLFYTAADSTLRWYGKPILWSQGSQQTGDTIYLRLKNNKLNTLQIIKNGFIVNVNSDSAKYNQVKGKLITAFFNNGEISNAFVDGNAESVYYNRGKDSVYTEMNQTVSSRIKILFKNKQISNILAIRDPEGVRIPIAELKDDVKLTGFSWVPELRPLSKKEVITGKPKSKTTIKPKTPVAAKVPAKTSKTALPAFLKNPTAKDIVKADSLINKADSLIKKQPGLLKKQ
ncbi:OstA-like protein [Pedobacter sp. PWIIR3]